MPWEKVDYDPFIDTSRPKIENKDGSFSTERTVSFEADGKHYLVPTIVSGKQLSPKEAIDLTMAGKNKPVGVYDSEEEATKAAKTRSLAIGKVRGQEEGEWQKVDYDPFKETGVGEAAVKGVVSGYKQINEFIGTGVEYLGKRLGSKAIADVGKTTKEYWKPEEAPPDLQGSIVKKPELLANPSWWVYNVVQTGTSMLPGMIAGVGTAGLVGKGVQILGKTFPVTEKLVERLATLGAATAGGIVGGAQEGSSTYNEVLERGGTEEQAARAAEAMTAASGFLNAISFGKMLAPGKWASLKRFLQTGATEAFTEYLEEPAEVGIKKAILPNEKFTNEESVQQLIEGLNVAPAAFVTGGVMGAVGGVQRKAQTKKYASAVKQVATGNLEGIPDEIIDNVANNAETLSKERPNDDDLKNATKKLKKEAAKRKAAKPVAPVPEQQQQETDVPEFTDETPQEPRTPAYVPGADRGYNALPPEALADFATATITGKDTEGNPFTLQDAEDTLKAYSEYGNPDPESIKQLSDIVEKRRRQETKPENAKKNLEAFKMALEAGDYPTDEDALNARQQIVDQHPDLADQANKIFVEWQAKKAGLNIEKKPLKNEKFEKEGGENAVTEGVRQADNIGEHPGDGGGVQAEGDNRERPAKVDETRAEDSGGGGVQQGEGGVKAAPEWEGKAYRAETGYRHDKGATAADVVRYEQEDLGNQLGVSDETIAELRNRPAEDIVWVTKKKGDAKRYGEGTEYELPTGSKILAEDGDGGYLVLKNRQEPPNAPPSQAEIVEAGASKTVKPQHAPFKDVVAKQKPGEGKYELGDIYWWEHPDPVFKEHSKEVIVAGPEVDGKIPTYSFTKEGIATAGVPPMTAIPELTPKEELSAWKPKSQETIEGRPSEEPANPEAPSIVKGNHVSFANPKGKTISGTVIKLNKRNVEIKTAKGRVYSAPIGKVRKAELKPAKPTPGKKPVSGQKEEIDNLPVNQAMGDAKAMGGFNYDHLAKDYDRDTLKELQKRLPGIISRRGTAKLDEMADVYGFEDADALMNAMLGKKGKKEALDEFEQQEKDWIENQVANLEEQERLEALTSESVGDIKEVSISEIAEEESLSDEELIAAQQDVEDFFEAAGKAAAAPTQKQPTLSEIREKAKKEGLKQPDLAPELSEAKTFELTAPEGEIGGPLKPKARLTKTQDMFAPAEKKQEPLELKGEKKIEDFGEKIGGARKDQGASLKIEYTDDDISKLPLSTIWPKSEVDAIEDKFIAAFAYTARAEIPTKPQMKHKVARWVEKVKTFRGLMKSIFDSIENGKYSRAHILKIGEHYALKGFFAKVKLLEAIDRGQWDRIGKVDEYPDAYRYKDGDTLEKIPAPSVHVHIDGRYKSFEGVKSIDEVTDKVNSILDNSQATTADAIKSFEVRGREGHFFINKKGDSLHHELKVFKTSKEAFDFRNNHSDELMKAWDEVKELENVHEEDVRRKENRPRTGKDHREGKDVTPQMFSDTFGFRGVEFGNWVSQGKNTKERQGMLNEAYDAMMDLADIVGIPPKAISLNGTLGLGFGSRGHGWASAHYEPDKVVINLTKTRGAGAFAHEWFHALDNYFQLKRGGGGAREKNYITYNPETYYQDSKSGARLSETRYNEILKRGGIREPANWSKSEAVRPEVAEAFANLVKALDASPMAERVNKIKSEYWSRIIERAARSFENYVIVKMNKQGYQNDYLANVVSLEDFKRMAGRYPYLFDDEIAPVEEAFDRLFNTLETKETDKGLALNQAAAAYHGSPHDFDKFSTEKVGTGEGVQAYGYGLYFAGKKAVAKYYKEKLARRTSEDDAQKIFNDFIQNYPNEAEQFAEEVGLYADRSVTTQDVMIELQNVHYRAKNGLRQIISDDLVKSIIDKTKGYVYNPGRLYEVELAPGDDEYLLWDRQTPNKLWSKILTQIRKEGVDNIWEGNKNPAGLIGNESGEKLYRSLSESLGGKKTTSAFLHRAGIRGIKYLDAPSRKVSVTQNKDTGKWFVTAIPMAFESKEAAEAAAEKERDYNYVIFSDQDVTIKGVEETLDKRGRYDIMKAKDKGLVSMLLDLELSNYGKNVKAVSEISDAGGRPGVQTGGPRTVASRIPRDFKTKGWVNLQGAEIRHFGDLAAIAQIFRDPRIETLRIFYVSDGKLVAHEGLSSRMPGFVSFYEKEGTAEKQLFKIARRAKRLKADKIYLLHNHPTGMPIPSVADIGFTQKVIGKITKNSRRIDRPPPLVQSLVIDHDTYAVVDPVRSSYDLYAVPEEARQTYGEAEKPNELLLAEAFADTDIIKIGKALQTQKGYSVLVFRTSTGHVGAIQEVPTGQLKAAGADDFLRGMARKFGGRDVVVYTDNIEDLGIEQARQLIKNGSIADAVCQEGSTYAAYRDTAKKGVVFGKKAVPTMRVAEEGVNENPFPDSLPLPVEEGVPSPEKVNKAIEKAKSSLDKVGMAKFRETLDGYIKKGKVTPWYVATKLTDQSGAIYLNPDSEMFKALFNLRDKAQEAIPHLITLGRQVYESGANRLDTWRKGMKKALGDLWTSFKGVMEAVWMQMKKTLKSERGSIEISKGKDTGRKADEILESKEPYEKADDPEPPGTDATPDQVKEYIADAKDAVVQTVISKLHPPHMSAMEKWLASPEWYGHPTFSRIVRLFMRDREELYHEIYFHLTDIGEATKLPDDTVQHYAERLKHKGLTKWQILKGQTSQEYKDLEWAIDYGDTEYKRNKKLKLKAQVAEYEKFLREEKKFSEDTIDAWRYFRESYDKALDLMTGQMREMIARIEEEAAFKGQEPADYSDLYMTLKGALATMETWKGFYAPRQRQGDWAVVATMPGGGIHREHAQTEIQAQLLAKRLKREGYEIRSIREVQRLPEDVYQDIKTGDVAKAIESALDKMSDNEKASKFNEELLQNVADMIKMRGFRSSMIHRKPGDNVVTGYITDPIERHGIYINGVARGTAKSKVAQAAYELLYGTYIKGRKFGGIDPKKEPKTYTAAKDYIEEQLRNMDSFDRLIAWGKAIATLKFLGFSGRSAIVNMTAMVTTAPPAIHQYATAGKGSLMQINRALAAAGRDYAAFMLEKEVGTQEERQFLLEAKRLGWDNAQYTRDAMARMAKLHGRAWNVTMDAAMWLFGKTEQWNRGSTMLAAYRIAKKQGMDEKDAREVAKQASDKAHGTYGRATLPAFAWGRNPAAKIGQMFYVYSKFPHNYLQMLWDMGFKKHNLKGAVYALLSPVVIGGMASFPFKDQTIYPIFNILFSLLGLKDKDEDFEKWVWDGIRDMFGTVAERTGRYGLAGLSNMDISGSLSIGVGVPKTWTEWGGAIGGAAEEIASAAKWARVGDYWRAAEHLLPAGFANVSRAGRERARQVTTERGYAVYDEQGKPYKPTAADTALRLAGARSARQATIQGRTYEAKRQAARFKDKRDAIYERYRFYLASGKDDKKLLEDIRQGVKTYNQKVRALAIPGASTIKWENLRRQAKEMAKAPKKMREMLK